MSFESPGFSAHRSAASHRAGLSADAHAHFGAPRNLPAPDTQLAAWLARSLGVAILALSALFVLSLLTWSVVDPSFSNAGVGQTGGLKPKNALGPVGAILADIVVQSLGLASVFALLPPVFWAAQLLSRRGIDGARAKLVMAPVSVLCLASFLSGLPKAPSWPLGSGYGGLLGDFGFQFVTSLFGVINADRAPLVTGICLMAAGFSLLMLSLGLTPTDLKRMAERRRTHLPDSGWVSHLKADQVLSISDEDVLAAGPSTAHPVPAKAHTGLPPMHDLPMPAPDARALVSELAATPTRQIPVSQLHAGPTPKADAAPLVARPETVATRPVAAVTVEPPQPALAPVAPAPVVAAQPQPSPAVAPARMTYRRPPLTLLAPTSAPASHPRDQQIAEKLRARKLAEALETFGVRAEVKGHVVGPLVTTFTVEPAAGSKSSRIIGLADDIARALGVASVRIQVTAARTALAIEVAHNEPTRLGLRSLIEHKSYHAAGHALPLALGVTATGEPCVADLADAAVLITGTDASARAAMLDTAVASLIYRHTPAMLRLLVGADTPGAASPWGQLPHLAAAIANGAQSCSLLTSAAAEIDARTLRMRALAQSQTIDDYNLRIRNGQGPDAASAQMPYLVVILGDLADVLRAASAEATLALETILRRGKAAGVHLIAAASVVTEDALPAAVISAFPVRISAQLANKAESRAVFGETGAEDLSAGSDVLLHAGSEALRQSLGGGTVQRLHTAPLRLSEAKAIATAAALPSEPDRAPVAPAAPSGTVRGLQDTLQQHWGAATSDTLYDRAVDVVRREQSASASALKRELSLTYGMATELIDRMALDGILSAPDAEGTRRVLIGRAA